MTVVHKWTQMMDAYYSHADATILRSDLREAGFNLNPPVPTMTVAESCGEIAASTSRFGQSQRKS